MDALTLAASIIAVLAAVASAWFARRNNVRDLQEQLDIVSEWAEKSLRAARTTRMREVRAAARADSAPPELIGPEPSPQTSLPLTDRKAQIRARARASGKLH